jgi:hypothetical protein
MKKATKKTPRSPRAAKATKDLDVKAAKSGAVRGGLPAVQRSGK